MEGKEKIDIDSPMYRKLYAETAYLYLKGKLSEEEFEKVMRMLGTNTKADERIATMLKKRSSILHALLQALKK